MKDFAGRVKANVVNPGVNLVVNDVVNDVLYDVVNPSLENGKRHKTYLVDVVVNLFVVELFVAKTVANLAKLTVVKLCHLYCAFFRKKIYHTTTLYFCTRNNATKHCRMFASPLPQVYHGFFFTTTFATTCAPLLGRKNAHFATDKVYHKVYHRMAVDILSKTVKVLIPIWAALWIPLSSG